VSRGVARGVACSFLAAIAALSGCSKQQAAPAARAAAIPVVVAKVTQKAMPVQLAAIGNVDAVSVSVEAQVPGELREVHFQEGDFVQKGQLLFTIDPRPYEAVLAQAQATLKRDKAVAENSRVQAGRLTKLLADGVVAPSDADASKSAADAAEATVAADEAVVKTAQLNLEYCKIYSPIDGRTGVVLIKPGNLVKVADTAIVVIKQLSPIHVNFTVPQEYLGDIKKYRELVSDFLDEAMRAAYQTDRDGSFDARGRYKQYSIVKRINEEVEKLTSQALSDQRDNLEILGQLGTIRGLLIDLMI
jgi:multidrug efflux system membrane fusion protein